MTEIISLADTIELVTSRDRFIVLQDTAVIQGRKVSIDESGTRELYRALADIVAAWDENDVLEDKGERRLFADSLTKHGCADPVILLDTFESVALYGGTPTGIRYSIDPSTVTCRLRRLESLVGESLHHYSLTKAGNTLLDKLLQMS